jgi:hypothetical protein
MKCLQIESISIGELIEIIKEANDPAKFKEVIFQAIKDERAAWELKSTFNMNQDYKKTDAAIKLGIGKNKLNFLVRNGTLMVNSNNKITGQSIALYIGNLPVVSIDYSKNE